VPSRSSDRIPQLCRARPPRRDRTRLASDRASAAVDRTALRRRTGALELRRAPTRL